MTREEAINNLESLYNEVYNEDSDGYTYAEAIDMAIEALSAPQTDLISRADAIEAVHKYFVDALNNEPHEIDEDGDDVFTDMKSVNALLHHNKMVSKALNALPSAEAVQGDECDHCVYKWGMKGGAEE